MPVKYDPNTLWVALTQYGDGNIFEVYPKLLAQLFLQEEAARQDGDTSEAEKLVLPSDKDYRLQKYFVLVELQKELEEDEDGNKVAKPSLEEPVEEWAPWSLMVATKNPHAPPPVSVKKSLGRAWEIGQVLKAARLLCKPPQPVKFIDEQEMRWVYSLIYEVFRYKTILDQALDDIAFMQINREVYCENAVRFDSDPNNRAGPCIFQIIWNVHLATEIAQHPVSSNEFLNHRHIVWLFLMELARRRWGGRARNEIDCATKLLDENGYPFKDIENLVWDQRIHLAASIARIRIKNRAFTLSDLLPAHLREERVSACVNKDTVTGWVNTFKAKKVALLVKRLHELGYTYSSSRQLCAGEYRFDRVCPRFITMRPPDNSSIGRLELVKNGVIVLQEREFCEGASTLCRALRANNLRGVVAQTHASSPRCSAYLAAQLQELAAVLKAKAPAAPATPELGKLVVFGAGDKVQSYVLALRELGIEASEAPQSSAPVCIISEAVHCDTPTVLNALDGVVAVLATPPNSYSAVTDPIDLVCGRGGDLTMLEILTESEIDVKGKERVQSILEEQKETLRCLMSKPQIQMILYETHSALEAENQAQITRAVAEANRLARERHSFLKRKHRQPSPQKQAAQSSGNEVVVVNESPVTNETISANESTNTLITTPRSNLDKDGSEGVTICQCPEDKSPSMSSPSNTAKSKAALKKQAESMEVQSKSGTNKAKPIPEMPSQDIPKDPDKDSPNVVVPSSDLFEIRTLPNLGNGLDINYILERDGCYLGLIQRKEITRLDAKFMIRVAEDRGLFGPGVSAAQPQRRKRVETAQQSPSRRRRRKNSFEVERVAAPTYASMSRSARRDSAPGCLSGLPVCSRLRCERHERQQAAASASAAAACTCNAKHRYRRCSVTGASRATDEVPSRLSEPPCRRPFPLAVHELQLKQVVNQHKIFAS